MPLSKSFVESFEMNLEFEVFNSTSYELRHREILRNRFIIFFLLLLFLFFICLLFSYIHFLLFLSFTHGVSYSHCCS